MAAKTFALLTGLVTGLSTGFSAFANPTGAQVVNGQVQFANPNAATLQITNSPNAIVNWQSFSVGNGELTKFIQQNANSAILNRVTGNNLSQILGQLQSNGRVFLINQNGIVFGGGAQVDTAGFIASTLNMTDDDFLAGRYNFAGTGNEGMISNQGVIRAGEGGNVILIAPDIENGGVVEVTEGGDVVLAAGKEISLTSWDNPTIQYQVSAPGNEVVNLGQVLTDGGTARLFAGTVRHSGEIKATGVRVGEDGSIELFATDTVSVESGSTMRASGVNNGGSVTVESDAGDTTVAGAIDVSADTGKGGSVDVFGRDVTVASGANINADGETGGGNIRIGGDYQGTGDVQRAENTSIEEGVVIDANATGNGDGGRVIIWADNHTEAAGQLNVRGGVLGGDGGFAEVSGKQTIGFNMIVDGSAEHGDWGDLLLDPTHACITNNASCTNGGSVFTETSVESSSIGFSITTTGALGIEIESGVNIVMTNAVTFTLTATGGAISMGSGSSITTQGTDISFIADNGITLDGSNSLETGGSGAISLTSSGTVTVNAGSTLKTLGGTIDITGTTGVDIQGAGTTVDTTGNGAFASGADITLISSGDVSTNGSATIKAGTSNVSIQSGGLTNIQGQVEANELSVTSADGVVVNNATNLISSFSAINSGNVAGITFVNDQSFTVGNVEDQATSGANISISTAFGGACGSGGCVITLTDLVKTYGTDGSVTISNQPTVSGDVLSNSNGRVHTHSLDVEAQSIALDSGVNNVDIFIADANGGSATDGITLHFEGAIQLGDASNTVQASGGDIAILGDATACATGNCDIHLAAGVNAFGTGAKVSLDTGGNGVITAAGSAVGKIEADVIELQHLTGTGAIGADGAPLYFDPTNATTIDLFVGNAAYPTNGVYLQVTDQSSGTTTLNINSLHIASPVDIEGRDNIDIAFVSGFLSGTDNAIDVGSTDSFSLTAGGDIDLTNVSSIDGQGITIDAQGAITFPASFSIDGEEVSLITDDAAALDLSTVQIRGRNNGAGFINIDALGGINDGLASSTYLDTDQLIVSTFGEVRLDTSDHAIDRLSVTQNGTGDFYLQVGNSLEIAQYQDNTSSGPSRVAKILGGSNCATADCDFTVSGPISFLDTGVSLYMDTGGAGSISQTNGAVITVNEIHLNTLGGSGAIGSENTALLLDTVSSITDLYIGSIGSPVGGVNIQLQNGSLDVEDLHIGSPLSLTVDNGALAFMGTDTTLNLGTEDSMKLSAATTINFGSLNSLTAETIYLEAGTGLDLSGMSVTANSSSGDVPEVTLVAGNAGIMGDASTAITTDYLDIISGGGVSLASNDQAVRAVTAILTGTGDFALQVDDELIIDGIGHQGVGGVTITANPSGNCTTAECGFTINNSILLADNTGSIILDTGGEGVIQTNLDSVALRANTISLQAGTGSGSRGGVYGGTDGLHIQSVDSNGTDLSIGSASNPVQGVQVFHEGDANGNASDLTISSLEVEQAHDVSVEVDNGNLDLSAGGLQPFDADLGSGSLSLSARGGSVLFASGRSNAVDIKANRVMIDSEMDLSIDSGSIFAAEQMVLRVGSTGGELNLGGFDALAICGGYDGANCTGSGVDRSEVSLIADRMVFDTSNTFIEAAQGEVTLGAANDIDVAYVENQSASFPGRLEITSDMLSRIGTISGKTESVSIGKDDNQTNTGKNALNIETAIDASGFQFDNLAFSSDDVFINEDVDFSSVNGSLFFRALNGGNVHVNANIAGGGGETYITDAVFNQNKNGIALAGNRTITGSLIMTDAQFMGGVVNFNGPVTVTDEVIVGPGDNQNTNAISTDPVVQGDGSFTLFGGVVRGDGDIVVKGQAELNGGVLGTGGAIAFNSGVDINDSVTINRDVDLLGDSNWNKGNVAGNGNVRVADDASLNIKTNNTFDAELDIDGGTLVKNSSGETIFSRAIDLFKGTINLAAGVLNAKSGISVESGEVVLNGGDLKGDIQLDGGRLTGSGVIDGNVNSQKGTIAPGFSPGFLSILHDLTLGKDSKLELEAAGTGANQYDRISVEGTTTLGGEIQIAALDGFSFDGLATDLDFISTNGLKGGFDKKTVPNGLNLEFDSKGVRVPVETVTEETLEQAREVADEATRQSGINNQENQNTINFQLSKKNNLDDAGFDSDVNTEAGNDNRGVAEDSNAGEDTQGTDQANKGEGQSEEEGKPVEEAGTDEDQKSSDKQQEGDESSSENTDKKKEEGDKKDDAKDDGQKKDDDTANDDKEGKDESGAEADDSEEDQDEEQTTTKNGRC